MSYNVRTAVTKIIANPCPRCGGFERYVSRGSACVSCARESGKARSKKFGETARGILTKAFRHAKWRAARNDLPFTVELDDLVLPDTCPVLGIALTNPSLDQHTPGLGYTTENTRIISWRANRLKNDGTLAEFEKLVAYLRLQVPQ